MHTPSWSRARSSVAASSPATPVYRPSNLPASTSSASLYSHPASSTVGPQSKLINVMRVAIEGAAKHDQDGATIRMYLKLALPVDSAALHTSIPLFPEGDVKILKSQVHPLDQNSSPYHYSPSVSPMLSRAAHALDLPKRLHESYLAVLEDASPEYGSTSSPFSRTNTVKGVKHRATDTDPLDERFTGKISVSNYQVTFVPPKELPSRSRLQQQSEENDTGSHPSRNAASTPGKTRRHSIVERNTCQFMAVIEVWIPYTSKPPRSPYALHIPVPRCLQNTIRLRISGAPAVASSFASLSSVEDEGGGGAWDVMCDPPVTRNTSRLSRTTSTNNFADDESSDSSLHGNLTEGCRVEGTFISTDMIRLRWSKPLKAMTLQGGQDTRRRAGVQQSSGEMTCTILGTASAAGLSPDAEGILMKVDYQGTCSGVWFPGVATQVALDLSLESKGSEVHWPKSSQIGWSVSGGVGFTGHHIGAFTSSSRPSSMDLSSGLPSPSEIPTRPRYDSSSSNSSLLRAPLPVPNVADYSFEGSTSSITGSGTSAPPSLFSSADPDSLPIDHNADSTITLHLNLDALNPPQSVPETFNFSITGTIVVVARHSPTRVRQKQVSHPPDAVTDVSLLPRFTLLAAEKESTSFTLRNEVPEEAMTVEVYNPSGDVHNAQTRKTVLQPGGMTKCGDDGARIALKVIARPVLAQPQPSHPLAQPVGDELPLLRISSPSEPSRPKIVPSVFACISHLVSKNRHTPVAYAVRVEISVHDVDGSGWLPFSLGNGVASRTETVVSSMNGRPILLESVDESPSLSDASTARDIHPNMKAFVGPDSGVLALDYILADLHKSDERTATTKIQLPGFEQVVGKYEVFVQHLPGFEVDSGNLAHRRHSQESSSKFFHFMATPHFSPQITVSKSPTSKFVSRLTPAIQLLRLLNGVTPYVFHVITMTLLFLLASEMQFMKLSAQSCPASQGSNSWNPPPTTYTVTTTVTPYHDRSTDTSSPQPPPSDPTPPLPGTFSDTTAHSTSPAPANARETQLEGHGTPIIDIRKTYTHVHDDSHDPPTSTPASQPHGDAQVALMYYLPWSAREQVHQLAQTAAAHIVRGMNILLYVAQKLYNYPLDPP